MLKTQNRMEYSSVSRTADGEEGLVWLSGYIPETDAERFTQAAKENGWAYAIGDPEEDDEHIPTKVKYNKLTALMEPVFDILGTVPGYKEYDISFWFLCFFTLFFAMIIVMLTGIIRSLEKKIILFFHCNDDCCCWLCTDHFDGYADAR